ncbi:MAG: hypothetical protein AABZ61_02450 [Bacteroidota bacterium]
MKLSMLVIVALGVSLLYGSAAAQFKSQTEEKPRVAESMIRPEGSGSFLGFFKPENFMMRHSYSFSYMLMSGRNVGVGMYTNSMFYKVSDPLDVRLDVSLMHSPFNSFGKQYQNDLNKLFINRAEVNYRPFDNMIIQLQYRQVPFSPYWGYNSPYYYSPFYQGSDFYR